ncbi:nucleotide pyrophosphohydrolase [Actinoplanes sp. CA-252034]|uniref:nucleotide pyrophosphohydrolase n=1 Tax=Actinoplanes sp. CA-252034 TaxID=3239906 RepID=UPI003D98704C
MDLSDLQTRALMIAELYDRHHAAAGRERWSTGDLALGFVGDVGDLAKLVMAVDGRRVIPDAEAKLGHELADCLWSVLVLADRYDVDLVAEFARMTDGIEENLRAEGGPATRTRR